MKKMYIKITLIAALALLIIPACKTQKTDTGNINKPTTDTTKTTAAKVTEPANKKTVLNANTHAVSKSNTIHRSEPLPAAKKVDPTKPGYKDEPNANSGPKLQMKPKKGK